MQTPSSRPSSLRPLHRRLTLSSLLGAMTVLLAACSATVTSPSGGFAAPAAGTSLVPSQWNAVRILDVPVPADAGTFLWLDVNGTARGNTGCNVWSAAFLQDEPTVASSLRFGDATTTRRLCDSSRDQTEKRFLSALPQVRSHQFQGSQLVLLDAAGKEVMRLARRPA